jgi:hypothetical protein
MKETDKKNKAYGSAGQNWGQHTRILFHLHEKRMTVRGLAESIHERILMYRSTYGRYPAGATRA